MRKFIPPAPPGCAPADALLTAMHGERSELVLVDQCEALAALAATEGVPLLKRLAKQNSSGLARAYAVTAVAELLGRESIPFLKSLHAKERSRRVLTTLEGELCHLRQWEFFESLLGRLASKDYIVRIRVASLLRDIDLPGARGPMAVRALEHARRNEDTVAALYGIREALRELRRRARKMA